MVLVENLWVGKVSRFHAKKGGGPLHWLIGGVLDRYSSVTKLHGELEAEPAILNACRDLAWEGASFWSRRQDLGKAPRWTLRWRTWRFSCLFSPALVSFLEAARL